eukprot:gene15362-18223_t
METWTSALQTRSTAGRGSSGKIDLYGIKKLRELILELAVRGKLVPQDPNDEPASELLKRIAAEKAELVKQGKIKKQKPLPEISEEEKPFELPEGWEWARINDIASFTNGYAFKSSEFQNSGVGIVKIGDIDSSGFISTADEQVKIIARVKLLISLCDQLEQQSLTSLDAHQQLVETLLGTLTDSQNAEELAENWARISEHFDTLFTTEASVDALKQTILQLAVMGKLVPQDPNDEPASELLKRIAQEKAQLVKEGKIKKQKPLPPISDEEKPFELPEGWEWCKFGLTSEFINGDRGSNYPNKNEYVSQGIPWINTGHIEKNGTLTVTEMNFITEGKFNELRSRKIQKGDLVYCLRGATFGKTAFVIPYETGAIASSLMIIRPFITEMGGYIYNYLTSPFGRSQIYRFDNGSAQPNLSANSVMLYSFPCPPLTEQYRIFSQVGLLHELCDKLKTRIKTAQQTQLHLADALTDAAIN